MKITYTVTKPIDKSSSHVILKEVEHHKVTEFSDKVFDDNDDSLHNYDVVRDHDQVKCSLAHW